ncbi:MAG: hypothetical protein QCI82_05720 [Candidatus Thermoplasmatota archaeon]|nr:hypothetical protein [Candidatus Thermoplasmatota archaeon]
MKNIGKTFGTMFGLIVIVLMILPTLVSAAIVNEQRIGGYNPDPGGPIYADTAAIDSVGNDVVAVFSQQTQQGGFYNVYITKSVNGGGAWSNPVRVFNQNVDQLNPDVVLVDINENLVAFIVWKQGGYLKSKALYLSNLSCWEIYSQGQQPKTLTDEGVYNYPRIAGKNYYSDGHYAYVFIVWEAYVSNQRYEIQMKTCLWEENANPSISWSDVIIVARDFSSYSLRHPTIDFDIDVVITYDCINRGTNINDVKFKRYFFTFSSLYPEYNDPFDLGVSIFPTQYDYYYPEITIKFADYRVVVVGQKIDDVNYIIGRSCDFSLAWDTAINVGNSSVAPSLRGVAVDSTVPDERDEPKFDGGIKAMWANNSKITSRKLKVVSGSLTALGTEDTDTYGYYDGELTHVAISLTYVYEETIREVFGHHVYMNYPGSVIYYTENGD